MTKRSPVAGRRSPVAGGQGQQEVEATDAIEATVAEVADDAIEAADPGDRQPATGDRNIEIAENDAGVQRELKRLSRRGFITFGAGAIATAAAWKWLRAQPKVEGVERPLRRAFGLNENVAEGYFSQRRLNRTFPPSAINFPRINGGEGLSANYDVSTWRLDVTGGAKPVTLTFDDLKQLPKRTMITEFRCIEGWSMVVKWGGVRFADLAAEIPPADPRVRYVGMETPGRGYYVGLDMQSAMHPQTLLAYELNDQPLSWQHGAPVRLAIPVKYGVKNIKRVSAIRYTDVRPADFWAERGYDWYLGL